MIHSCACVKGGFNVAIEQINAAIEHPGVWIIFFRIHPRGEFLQPKPRELVGKYQLLAVADGERLRRCRGLH